MIPDQGPETEIIVGAVEPVGAFLGPTTAPIFVDETGRRSRLVGLAAYGIVAVCLGYTALVGISLAGGLVLPNALMPFPDRVSLANRDGAPAENLAHRGLGQRVPGPLVAPIAPPTRPGDPDAPRTSAAPVAVRPTPSPSQGSKPVSPPPATSRATQPPKATPTLPPPSPKPSNRTEATPAPSPASPQPSNPTATTPAPSPPSPKPSNPAATTPAPSPSSPKPSNPTETTPAPSPPSPNRGPARPV